MSSNDHGDDGWGKPAYQVGYGKPPRKHQFKKGRSGNPKGRKPRVKNFSTLLAAQLDQVVVVREGNIERKLSKRELLAINLLNDAIKGKAAARQLLLKLMHVEPPVDPFVADNEDEAALEAFLKRQLDRS